MTLLGAQAVYVGQPVLKVAIPQGHLDALVNLLEDPTQTRAFITYLREETAS
jgi:hypothetical protein